MFDCQRRGNKWIKTFCNDITRMNGILFLIIHPQSFINILETQTFLEQLVFRPQASLITKKYGKSNNCKIITRPT